MKTMALLAKVSHRISDMIPGVRFRVWNTYRCTLAEFVGYADPEIVPRRIDPSELSAIRQVNPGVVDPNLLSSRFDNGNECWIVELAHEPVYYQWTKVNQTNEPIDLGRTSRAPRAYMLPPKSIYFWDAWCSIACRGRGINRKTKAAILTHYAREGVDQALVAIAPFNSQNIRSCSSIGFKYQRTLIEFSLGRRPPG